LAAFLVGCNVKAISVEKYLTLTLSQKTALDEFKDKVMPTLKDNYMKQDTYLIQWLRELKWREENGIDNITKEDWSDMTIDYPFTIDTYDKTGRPIGVIDIYDWNTRGAVLSGKGARLHRYDISIVENITRQIYELQEKGMHVTQVVIIGSADGFNVVQHACPVCVPIWIQFVQVIESYYPGALDELIIIDVGVLNIYEWDLRKAVLQGRSKRLMRYLIYGVEITGSSTNTTKRNECNAVVVLGSAEGFNLISMVVQFVSRFGSVCSDD
ncbi:SEC14-like protein 4, partial [Orchesella cincta]